MNDQVPQGDSDAAAYAARALCHAAAHADPHNDCQGLWDAVTVHLGGLGHEELVRVIRMLVARVAAESKLIELLAGAAGAHSVARIVAQLGGPK